MKKNLSLMIKPASSKCNINCNYCFYNNISNHREIKDYGFMKIEIMKITIDRAIEFCNGGLCTIGFQGGEPLLRGIYFYRELIEYIKEKKTLTKFNFFIQTNGILINEEWCKLFKDNNFLVGVSLDGNKEIHDNNRVDSLNNGSFDEVMNGINTLKKFQVDFNILSVVTKITSQKISNIYNFFKRNNFKYLQFIPCLSPIQSKTNDTLKSKEYEIFLKNSFDLWYKDVEKGKFISIRYFDNLLGYFLGHEYESCDMKGKCSCQQIIESDGSAYPCDFYTNEINSIGNVLNENFNEMHKKKITQNFINESLKINSKCNLCKYKNLCRNGCKKFRNDNLNTYCNAYYNFFEYSFERFKKLALKIK